jgi:NADPH:quinone reductase-like Zn-dependent oxidoreductase
MSWPEAGAFPEALCTAWLNLAIEGGLRAGERVLVHAGGSGVGTAAIQLAHSTNAFIFTTAGSAAKLEACRKLGANVTINYKEESFAKRIESITEGRGVSMILDMIGAPFWNDNLAALGQGGRLLLIGMMGGASGNDLKIGTIMGKKLTVTGTTLRGTPLPLKIALTESFSDYAMPLFSSSEIRPILDRTFTLEQAEQAHQFMESNANFGKIVLRVS